jgi:tRNA pseudouridine38-40 synthase
MRNLKLTIAYDGTDYVGWQVQKNGISVQQRLEEAWLKVTRESIRITASGRTDGGVHAKAQVCGLKTASPLDFKDIYRALNAETPFDISILKVEDAPEGFHAIRDAIEKTYNYQIQYGRILNPLRRRFCWFVPVELKVEAMREAASCLVGEYDFASFQSAGAERLSTIRTISQLEIADDDRPPFPGLRITITADGFLYKMVRNIIGTLVRVGRGTESPEWVSWVRDQKNRQAAGESAPAHGLCLERVVYDEQQLLED